MTKDTWVKEKAQMNFRIEKDSFGEIQVPQHALYGAQTQRSLQYFAIGQEIMPLEVIHAYGIIKKVAAKVNQQLGQLDEKIAQAIILASQELIDGKLDQHFPLRVWQTGSGTQTNMNVNEVIAHRATILGGNKIAIHPNDHVNKSQSTNDTFPTAMHIAAAITVQKKLFPSLEQLCATFSQKQSDYAHDIKMGRTHLQDATPITFGQEISGWNAQLEQSKTSLKKSLCFVYELALGGTAVGTGLNSHPDYAQLCAKEIAKETQLAFVSAPNKFAALAANDAMAGLSGTLNVLACALMKIANDVRWLASGPRGGLGEISIAENEPGSSIMPGKVNPTQCEALSMVCCQVMGNHTTVSIACSQGNFELNVYKPVIIYNVMQSINLLADSIHSFNEHCAKSIKPNRERLTELRDRSLMLVTALTPKIGYDKAARVAKIAHAENKTLKEVVLEMELMDAAEFDALIKPELMLGPNK